MRKLNWLFFLLLSNSIIQYAAFAQDIVIRGTWVTNVGSEAMRSPEKIRETVTTCSKNGITDIFVVVWNRGITMYPSKVVSKYIGIKQDSTYKGFDPLKLFIKEGHAQGIRVHAWFEFGFSYAYKDSSVNHWLTKYPHWVGRDNKGNLLKKNGFFWWNALHPEVQTFMKQLVNEVVTNYKVDGIQGDDRLPAMPAEGGYDAYTKTIYATEHDGTMPPDNPRETTWLNWKTKRVSDFGKSLYELVKKEKPTCWVTWAPSIFPWSKEQYLQDWPTWLMDGYADYIIPQVYRYQLEAYEQTLKAIDKQVPATLKLKIFPGMLSSLADGYRAGNTLIQNMIDINRKYGYRGEVFFYYETIREASEKIYQP
ncbi:MAG: family 10 glycosylhydrolase [Chitinophagia bacterium]|jgi:uncharacterized lipoprotein YddW (UPF0748 family)